MRNRLAETANSVERVRKILCDRRRNRRGSRNERSDLDPAGNQPDVDRRDFVGIEVESPHVVKTLFTFPAEASAAGIIVAQR